MSGVTVSKKITTNKIYEFFLLTAAIWFRDLLFAVTLMLYIECIIGGMVILKQGYPAHGNPGVLPSYVSTNLHNLPKTTTFSFFEPFRTVTGMVCATFREACYNACNIIITGIDERSARTEVSTFNTMILSISQHKKGQ